MSPAGVPIAMAGAFALAAIALHDAADTSISEMSRLVRVGPHTMAAPSRDAETTLWPSGA